MTTKKISFSGSGDSDIIDALWDSLGLDELSNVVLSKPFFKKRYREYLVNCGIEGPITETILEETFYEWWAEMLDDTEFKISFDVSYLLD
jgi:hypothetical protein